MPFGHDCEYPDFAACVRDQQGKGHSLEESRRICGALQRDTEGKCKKAVAAIGAAIGRHYSSLANLRASYYERMRKISVAAEGGTTALEETGPPVLNGGEEGDNAE
jgi:hypothetical protein